MTDEWHAIIADFDWADKNACGLTLEPHELRGVLALLRAADAEISEKEAECARLHLELLSAMDEAGANLDRAVKAEAALAAAKDPAALTVAYLAGVKSERDRAKIASEGP